ncbi:hypothetical protein B0A49_13109, partial [Cryomyces minteri]
MEPFLAISLLVLLLIKSTALAAPVRGARRVSAYYSTLLYSMLHYPTTPPYPTPIRRRPSSTSRTTTTTATTTTTTTTTTAAAAAVMSFATIPILDLSLARSAATKPAFLAQLRAALLAVGFLYLANTGLPEELVRAVCREATAFFDLPDEHKLAIEMKRLPSFLGYSRLGNEMTASRADWREQLDLSTPHPVPGPSAPVYHNLLAPTQWPDPRLLPGFRPAFAEYMRQMSGISTFFTSLIAEAIGLPADAFDRFFDADQQHKLKIVKYPDGGDGVGQGVGPHKDSMLTSYLLQASAHRGLQAQNTAG